MWLSREQPTFRRLNIMDLLAALIAACLARLREIRHVTAGRRALARMDARMLSDIGVSPGEAATEASRRFWDTKPLRSRSE